MIEMDTDFAEEEVVENPTLKAAYNLAPLHQNQPLRWDHKVDLLGEKIYDKNIHLCEICELPILLYGRMLPCKHVFCFDCAVKCERTCKRCGNKVQKVEKSALGTVFVCVFGAPKHCTSGCRRTYLSLRDLQSHIAHRHIPKTTAESKTTSHTSLTSSHGSILPLPLTQQQASQQTQQSGSAHSVPPQLQPASSTLSTVSHAVSHSASQQHSPAMPAAPAPAMPSRTSPLMPVPAPTSNPSSYHPYGAPVHSGTEHSIYRPLDVASFPQKQPPPQQQHQALQQQPQIHHMQQRQAIKQDIGIHSSHSIPQQGALHQGHGSMPHDISMRHDIQPGHVMTLSQQSHNLPPPTGTIPAQDHHLTQGSNVQGDGFVRNDYQANMNIPQQDFQGERHNYPSDQNAPRHDYQMDHSGATSFQSDQSLPHRDFQRDNFRQDFPNDLNSQRQDFPDSRTDYHDNDMRISQVTHPPHNPLVQNIINTSRPPYSQNSQIVGGMPALNNQPPMSPSHGTRSSHPDRSPIPGNKNLDNFSSSQNPGAGSRTNVNLITVPIQDEGQYRPFPNVDPSQGGNSYSKMQNPHQQNPHQQNPHQQNPHQQNPHQQNFVQNNNSSSNGNSFNNSRNNPNQMDNSYNQGNRMNMGQSNMMPGMMQNFNRPPGMMGNPRNPGPNPRMAGPAGSPRFNNGNRWNGPRGHAPRMSSGHPRPRGDGPRGNYYKN